MKGFDSVSGTKVKRNQRNRASTSEPRSGSDRVNLGKAQHAVIGTRSNSFLILRVAFALKAFRTISGSQLAATTE